MTSKMDYTQVNLSKLCSNLNTFRAAEKYVDVTIQCEDVSFQCHRIILALASSFFDTMFSGNFKECTEKSISLPKTSSKIFEDVLQFIYTGNVTITSANILDILEASEFFGLPGIEELVVQFVQNNQMNTQNTLDLFYLACKTKKEKLIDRLKLDIIRNLQIASRKTRFLELSFEDLNDILTIYDDWWCLRHDDVLLGAIIRWINHCREKRLQYFKKLCKMIKNLNSEWMRYMITDFASDMAYSPSGSRTEELIDFYNTPETSRYDDGDEEPLHVFVMHAKENLIRVFSIDEDAQCCSFSCKIPMAESNQSMKCIALNDYLYSLHYVRRAWGNTDSIACNQSFLVSKSIDMSSTLSLKAPPVIFGDVNMCDINNQIYVYNQTLSRCLPSATTSNLDMFNDEEIRRGIYVYNRELDLWFPVPAMLKKLQNSCMTSLHNRLYLIGGECVYGGISYKHFAQAYDHREGAWQALPTTINTYIGADCCRSFYRDNLVDVCGGVSRAFEEYNIVAGKWTVLTPLPTLRQYHRFTCSYVSHKSYAMGGIDHDLSIQVFNPESEEEQWTNSSMLAEAAEAIGATGDGIILDNVNFQRLTN